MGNNNNLTATRWLAASLVLYYHAFVLVGSPSPLFMGWITPGTLGVYMFFSVSGYLIAQSWDSDQHMPRFLVRRALRIFPGLIVATLLTVFLLGPLFTSLSWREYFTHPYTLRYFGNMFLRPFYRLPGVFEDNPHTYAVNGSLWTLPLEFALYIALMSLGRLRVPRAATLLLAVLLMSLTKISESWEPDMLKAVYGHDLRQMAFCGAYFWGSAAFRRFRLEYLCTLSNVCLAAAIWLGLSRWPSLFATAGMVFLPFLTLAFGLATGSILGRLTNIDYSYEAIA